MSLLSEKIKKKLALYQPQIIPAKLPEAAVLVAITTEEKDPKLILTRRSQFVHSHPGEIALPGGKKEKEDKSPLQTALRESFEEINLKPNLVTPLGQLDCLISGSGIKVFSFVGSITANLPLKANEQELDKIFYVPLSFFLQKENHNQQTINIQQKNYRLPYYQYKSYRIWGLTAVIITHFINVIFEQNLELEVPHQNQALW